MSRHKNIRSLQFTLYNAIARHIISKCPKTDIEVFKFYEQKEEIRKFYSSLSPKILSHLFKLTLKINYRKHKFWCLCHDSASTTDYPTELYLIEILFTNDTEEVEYHFNSLEFNPFHFSQLLTVLRQYNYNIKKLEFKGEIRVHLSAENYRSLGQLLVSAFNLRELTLSGFCTDELLGTIGKTCIQLVMLDVSHSAITDKGLTLLTQTITTDADGCFEEKCNSQNVFGDFFKPYIPSMFSVMTLEGIMPEGKDMSIYHRKKTPICKTLRILSFYDPDAVECPNLNITYKGLLLVLALVGNIEELKLHLDALFEYLAEKDILDTHFNESFNLKNILLKSLSKRYLKVLKLFCPHMKSLEVGEVGFGFKINKIPHLESLTISEFEHTKDIKPQLTKYLMQKGRFLMRLSLYFDEGYSHRIDLTIFLLNCPNLNFLKIETHLRSINVQDLSIPHDNLEVVHLWGKLNENSTVNLVKSVRNVREIFILTLSKKKETLVHKLCLLPPRDKLKLLWINNKHFLETEDDLMLFLNHYKHVRVLGRLPIKLQQRFGLQRYSILEEAYDDDELLVEDNAEGYDEYNTLLSIDVEDTGGNDDNNSNNDNIADDEESEEENDGDIEL